MLKKNVLILLSVFILLFISISFITAQQRSDDWYKGKPIADIRFTGLKNVSESELKGIVQPYIGKNFTDDLFLDLQSTLYALDYFETFIPNAIPGDDNYDSIIIEFDVQERPVVDKIIIQGNKNVREGDIKDVVLLKKGDMVNKTKVQLDSDAIKKLYLERGYPNVTVDGEIKQNKETNTADVTFTVQEGLQTRIKEIRFSGNSFASDSTLQRVMDTKPQSLFSKGVFQESKFQEDISKIEKYYWEHGYVDAKVANVKKDIEPNPADGRNYMIITVFIEEGEQYTFGGIEFEGNDLFSDEQLLEQVRLKPGAILDKTKLDADFVRISDVYYNEGYIYTQITKEPVKDEENKVISYKVYIAEHGRAHIENIIIKGNEKTKDYVIYRELPFEVGDVFSKKKIMEGLQNLYNTGLFSAVNPTTPYGSVDGLMDLIIDVEEGKTIDLNFGVTFSGASGTFPVLGFLKWTDRNFLGRGQSISAGAEVSGNSQKLTFSFNDNWLFGKRWSWGADFSVEHALEQDIQQDILSPVFSADDPNAVPDPYEGYYVFSKATDYSGTSYSAGDRFPGVPSQNDIDTYDLYTDYKYALLSGDSIDSAYLMEYHSVNFSLGLTTGYTWHTPIGRVALTTGGRTSLEFLTYDPSLYRPFNETTRNNLDQWQFTNKIWFNAQWDTRDYVQNPTSGFNLNANVQYVGGVLFGVSNYIRTSTTAETFFKLFDLPVFKNWNWKMVLALHTDFAILLPQYRRDSSTKAWGWGNEIQDDDYLYIDSMQIARGWGWQSGGMSRWNNWIELRMPVIEKYLWWDFFFSGTAMWDKLSYMKSTTLDDFMFTFGGGFRLTIPGFPMGFYLAKRFRTQDGTVQWQTGNIGGTKEGAGIDFVISFTYDIF